ncbi:MAG: error-prone DNA polymerase, partial [Myxococcota bacterium]
GPPPEVRAQVDHELDLIEELDFSGYFLTVWDIVRWARTQGILCQGRGSAANSVVCYAIGITSIDPIRMNLLFERFISAERGEPPDIDVDFEHDRREEVMQYVFRKYGRERAAMVANVICYRDKLAFREVGKVFGLGTDQLDRLSRTRSYWGASEMREEDLREAGLDPKDARVGQVARWGRELVGFPRHLGLHSGGFVITRQPLVEIVPVENATMERRTVIAWDKRDVETLGLVKVDLLALGMLSVVRRCFDFIRDHEGLSLDLAAVPAEDDRVYEMIREADTMGTFQVESRAQMQMLPRLKPKTFYDLVVSVAIVRPGPIQGDMIHPYLRRRDGEETVDYPHPALEVILGKTYGIPLFQEQVMKMAVAVAGFTPGEADQLRRAIGWQSQLHIDQMRERLVEGMLANGLDQDFAERIFRMIQGFGGYGFPESHAASFALIGYASCYLKRYHPAAFLAALLNSQPMGFYRPHTLVADAQRHGVEVRPVSVVDSGWDAHLEAPDPARGEAWWASSEHPERHHTPWADDAKDALRFGQALQPAVRLGFRSVTGMSEEIAERMVAARAARPFANLADVMRRAELPRAYALRLAAAGAFAPFGLDRRRATWELLALERSGPLFAGVGLKRSGGDEVEIPRPSLSDCIQADYEAVGMCLDVHPMQLLRSTMDDAGVLGSKALRKTPAGRRVEVGGLVVIRQRPSTAAGVVFITLEDEDGHLNLVVFNKIFERFKPLARDAPMLRATGKLERTGDVLNVVVDRFDVLRDPSRLEPVSRDFR